MADLRANRLPPVPERRTPAWMRRGQRMADAGCAWRDAWRSAVERIAPGVADEEVSQDVLDEARSVVSRALRSHVAMTRTEIARETRLSPRVVWYTLRCLMRERQVSRTRVEARAVTAKRACYYYAATARMERGDR